LNPSVKMTAKVWMTVCGLLASAAVAAGMPATAAAVAALKLAHSYPLPADIKGHFDHFGVDAEGKRLFGTAVEDRMVVVFDFGRGKLIKEMPGVQEPRAVLYRSDLSKLYVSDGGGALRVFDSNTFAPLQSFNISVDADPIVYDPATHRLFVVNGGEKAHHEYSSVTAFDTTASTQLGEVRLRGIEVEGMTVESAGPRVFANGKELQILDIGREPMTFPTMPPAGESMCAVVVDPAPSMCSSRPMRITIAAWDASLPNPAPPPATSLPRRVSIS
jgi:hypothetical protein